jgi:uncharacterized membrane protein YeiH
VVVAEVPAVVRSVVLAVAGVAGGLVVVGGVVVVGGGWGMAITGAAVCFCIRLVAIRRGWRLPVADHPQRPTRRSDEPDDGAGSIP